VQEAAAGRRHAPPRADDPVTQYVPSARPGSRAPHVWLQRDGARISTIDLFGPRFVLLTGRRGGPWREAARPLMGPSRPPPAAYTIAANGELTDVDDAWQDLYEVDDDGAVLVRPDGYVAWRSRTATVSPPQTLRAAMDGVLGRAPRAAVATAPR
jgi:putative polyketide hydroxylase